MDSCLYDLKEYECGLRMDELSVKCLLYADNQVILAPSMCRLQEMGLMMEPEGKHRNSIMKQRILAVFGLVEIVLRCTLTMNDFQGLMMQLEGSDNGSLEAPSSDPESQSWSKSISGPFQQAQIWRRRRRGARPRAATSAGNSSLTRDVNFLECRKTDTTRVTLLPGAAGPPPAARRAPPLCAVFVPQIIMWFNNNGYRNIHDVAGAARMATQSIRAGRASALAVLARPKYSVVTRVAGLSTG
ncbi:hypothetical protein EVAR_41097_1 [Eumeta japonica]|uniref:Uncharacterized protein n=1 Tax=Eumeta variegata TaxID=151549 RepID=A0A4C1XBI1_EUMVA|nr:hypothetical protein EVAR_41097_1 [Eumeta japonica]